MSNLFGIFDFRRDRYAFTFKAADTLAAKRHVQFLLSQPSSPVAKHPRRYGLTQFIATEPDLFEGLNATGDAAAFVVDVADLLRRDASTVGYDVGPSHRYVSSRDPAFAAAVPRGTVH